jgi:hypothetical protein
MPQKRCRYCGTETPDEWGFREVWGYDWDSNDEMALSEQRLQGYECAMVTDCAQRIVEQGSNIEGLRMILENREYIFTEIVEAAREQIRELSQMARELSRTADLVARENGYGVIGGMRGEPR